MLLAALQQPSMHTKYTNKLKHWSNCNRKNQTPPHSYKRTTQHGHLRKLEQLHPEPKQEWQLAPMQQQETTTTVQLQKPTLQTC